MSNVSGNVASGGHAIKVEPCQEALVSSYGYANNLRFYRGRGQRGAWRGQHRGYRGSNNAGSMGEHAQLILQVMTAILCVVAPVVSFRHLMANFPDSWENMGISHKVSIVESTVDTTPSEQVILFTGYRQDKLHQLSVEAQCCAVLDCACSSTVCGQEWLVTM